MSWFHCVMFVCRMTVMNWFHCAMFVCWMDELVPLCDVCVQDA